MRTIDFLSPKVAALCFCQFANRCICLCENTFLQYFVFANGIGSYVYVYVIFKTEQGNKRIREKSDIEFLFWKH